RLTGVEERIAEIEAELLTGDVPSLSRVLRTLEAQRKELAEQLAQARRDAAHPLSESWGECQAILRALDEAPDPKEVRLRLRAARHRILDSIYMVVSARGRDRLCAVQIWFVGEKRHRDYAILHRPPKANAAARQEGSWEVAALAPEFTTDLALDLRDPKN